jgi:hypothetical protein
MAEEVKAKTTINGVETFVDAAAVTEFLSVTRRRALEMARTGNIPAHPIGNGKRKTWRFRLSEVAQAIATEKAHPLAPKRVIIDTGSPRQPNRRN